MSLIADLTPTNYQQEKERFLIDPSFDPQFEYVREFTEDELLEKGLPSERYLELANKILKKASETFTPEEFEASRGEILSEEKVNTAIEDFLGVHKLDNRFELRWSADFVSIASVTDDNVVKLRRPCSIHENDLLGLIYHEIGTHALRRINYQQQPWYKKKKRYGFAPYLKTEEGLATMNSLMTKKQPFAYRASINYLATQMAQESSFLEVWNFVRSHISDKERAFAMTFRKKRGLKDTQRPGGSTKDLVYFEGVIDTVEFLIANDFPMKELYFGKMSWQDIDKAVKLNPDFEPILPIFYTQDPDAYQEKVRKVARTNFLA